MTPEAPKTLLDACRYYADPKVCFETMIAVKWPDGKVVCPKCGGDNVGAENLAAKKKARRKRVYTAHKTCNLAHFRLTLGLTIRDVAEGTGLSNAFICQVEHGCEVSLTNARKLCAFFGKSVDELWPIAAKEPRR